MSTLQWQTFLVWLLKTNLVVWAINALIFTLALVAGSTFVGILSSGFFSKLTLLETGIALVVAGGIAFSGSASTSKAKEIIRKIDEPWSIDKLQKSEKRANKYVALAAILFAESLLVSFLGL